MARTIPSVLQWSLRYAAMSDYLASGKKYSIECWPHINWNTDILAVLIWGSGSHTVNTLYNIPAGGRCSHVLVATLPRQALYKDQIFRALPPSACKTYAKHTWLQQQAVHQHLRSYMSQQSVGPVSTSFTKESARHNGTSCRFHAASKLPGECTDYHHQEAIPELLLDLP